MGETIAEDGREFSLSRSSIFPFFLCLWVFTSFACARDIEVDSPGALMKALAEAVPGTRILVAPGTYNDGFWMKDVHGEPDKLIVVTAKDPAHPPVFRGQAIVADIRSSSYFMLENLILREAGQYNLYVRSFNHHFILKGVQSLATRGNLNHGNCDGIKIDASHDFLVYGCTVEHWGPDGSAIDMVGCRNGLVARSRFAYPDLKGETANGLQAKGYGLRLGFYRNRFEQAAHRAVQFGGVTFGGNAKQYEGFEQVAMGNVIVGGEAPVAFVTCSQCLFAYNTIIRPDKYAFRILREGRGKQTEANTFAHNLIVYGDIEEYINIGDSQGRVDVASHVLRDNYWYKTSAPAASVPKLPLDQRGDTGGEDPKLGEDFRPALDAAKPYGAFAPEMEKAWAKHTDKFAWAWEWAQKFEKEDKKEEK